MSGSGKSYLASEIEQNLVGLRTLLIEQDFFYHSLGSKLPGVVNFDHPEAIDFKALINVVASLRDGLSCEIPVYDFVTHKRQGYRNEDGDYDVIIVEGILVLAMSSLRELFDFSIFVDTDPDLCLIRRLQRDCAERGRTANCVIEQYLNTVRPMALQYVLPSSDHADYKYKEASDLEIVCRKITSLLESSGF